MAKTHEEQDRAAQRGAQVLALQQIAAQGRAGADHGQNGEAPSKHDTLTHRPEPTGEPAKSKRARRAEVKRFARPVRPKRAPGRVDGLGANGATTLKNPGPRLQQMGADALRYGLATILVSVGALKFTAYEASAARDFAANSPLVSWVYDVVSVRTFAGILGAVEISLGLSIAARRFAPRLSMFGSIGRSSCSSGP